MPLSIRIDSTAPAVWARASGRLTQNDVLVGLADLTSASAFEPGIPQLLDLRDVTHVDISGDELHRIVAAAGRLGDRLGGGKLALVAGAPVTYGLSRMYEVFTESIEVEVRVFRDPDEAHRWLGVASEGRPEP